MQDIARVAAFAAPARKRALGRLRKFFSLERDDRRRLLAAFWQLWRARRMLDRESFRDWISRFDKAGEGGGTQSLSEAQRQAAESIGRAVRTAAGHTPWQSTCLVQVLAAQRMLQARGIGGVVHIGASPGGGDSGNGFSAHAWLVCGDRFVVGEAGHERFETIASYPWGVSDTGGDALYSVKD